MAITGSIPATIEQTYKYTAGENIAARSVICLGESDDKVYKAQATSWSRMPAMGITKAGVNIDETVEVYQFGVVTNVSRTEDFSYDAPVFVSETAGKLTKIPIEGIGGIYQEIGRANNSSDVVLNIQDAIVIGA